MKVIAYIRVSTDNQELGLEVQRTRIAAYCVAHDLELIEVYVDDGFSAKNLERPGIKLALAALETVDGLVVYKLDRLTRSIRDLGQLIEEQFQKRKLMSVCDHVDTRTASGKLLLNILMSVAQWERETIGERTREALAALKASGVKLGNQYSEDASEGLLTQVESMVMQGYSLRNICSALNVSAHRPNRSKRWNPSVVAEIIKRNDIKRVAT